MGGGQRPRALQLFIVYVSDSLCQFFLLFTSVCTIQVTVFPRVFTFVFVIFLNLSISFYCLTNHEGDRQTIGGPIVCMCVSNSNNNTSDSQVIWDGGGHLPENQLGPN